MAGEGVDRSALWGWGGGLGGGSGCRGSAWRSRDARGGGVAQQGERRNGRGCSRRAYPAARRILPLALALAVALLHQASAQIKDHYKTLGLPRTANTKDIKKAYHRLSLKFHPDKNQDKDKKKAETIFIRVREAYEVLSDPKRRAAYDAAWGFSQRQQSNQPPPPRPPPHGGGAGSAGGGGARPPPGGGGRRTERGKGDDWNGEWGGQWYGPDGDKAGNFQDFNFNFNGRQMSFEELCAMIRQWESQSSELRMARAAFEAFVSGLSEEGLAGMLGQSALVDSPGDGMVHRVLKRVARWMIPRAFRWLKSIVTGMGSSRGGEL